MAALLPATLAHAAGMMLATRSARMATAIRSMTRSLVIRADVRGDPKGMMNVWMDDGGDPTTFQGAIAAKLDVTKRERVHIWPRPAGYADEYSTRYGKFRAFTNSHYSSEFRNSTTLEPELFEGTDVSSDESEEVMRRVVEMLRASGEFDVRENFRTGNALVLGAVRVRERMLRGIAKRLSRRLGVLMARDEGLRPAALPLALFFAALACYCSCFLLGSALIGRSTKVRKTQRKGSR